MSPPDPPADHLAAVIGAEGRARHSLSEVADLTGLDADDVTEVWAALGRPVTTPDGAFVSDLDVRLMRNVNELARHVAADDDAPIPAALIRTLRTATHALRRVGEAHVTGLVEPLGPGPVSQEEVLELVERSSSPMQDVVLDLWTQAVNQSVAALVSEVDDPANPELGVGFVDLAGFTARSQQLETKALAELIERFDRVSGEVLAERGATLIKTIGDEVMFVHRNPASAAWTALDLVDRFANDELLLRARGGVTWGRPLRIGGDYYGPTVNLAARLVQLAFPNSVLVDDALAAQVTDETGLELVPMRPQRLRGCGLRRIHVAREITVETRPVRPA